MKIRPGVELASMTDVGCSRKNNEDSYCYWEPEDDDLFQRLGRLAIVADGMGGYEGGQIASRLAVEVVRDAYAAASDESDPGKRLLHAFAEAHRCIQQRAASDPALKGMGTTCTAFVVVDGKLRFSHLGDTRLYLATQGRLQLLTRDHTLVGHWVEAGVLNPEEAETHPQKHVLTAALGVSDQIQPDFPAQPPSLQRSDVLLLCSDGLWGQISESDISEALGAASLDEIARKLVGRAKANGGPDNITLVLLRIL